MITCLSCKHEFPWPFQEVTTSCPYCHPEYWDSIEAAQVKEEYFPQS